MVKQPTQKQTLPSKSRIVKLVLLGLLVTVLIFTVFAVLAYRSHKSEIDTANQKALVADRAKFAAVEQDMDKAYADIVAAVGKPQVEEKDKDCGRPQLKFSEGNLNCAIRFTFAYPEYSYSDSYTRTMRLQDVLKRSAYYTDSSDSVFYALDAEDKNSEMSDMNLRSPYDVHCDVIYNYAEPELYNHVGHDFSSIKTEYFSYYQYECSSDVKLAVYP